MIHQHNDRVFEFKPSVQSVIDSIRPSLEGLIIAGTFLERDYYPRDSDGFWHATVSAEFEAALFADPYFQAVFRGNGTSSEPGLVAQVCGFKLHSQEAGSR